MADFQRYSATQLVLTDIQKGKDPSAISVRSNPFADYFNFLLSKRNIPLAVLAELSGINRATLYKILSGNINPSRNIIIRLGLELHANFDEMQSLLKAANCSSLSGTRRRDVFIINAVVRHQAIDDLDRVLMNYGLESIYNR